MIIKNAKIYGKKEQDLEISNGLISTIAPANSLKGESFDASGLTLIPSFIDLNINLKNNKFSLENLELLENECLKSGISSIVLRDEMYFDEESFALFLQNLRQKKIEIFASIKVLNKENEFRNLATLINKGAFGIELQSSFNANILRMAAQYAFMKNVPIFAQCLNMDFDDNGVMNECEKSFELGLVGISEVAETSEVAKIKEIAKFYKARVIFDIITLKDSLNLLENELVMTSIHHLIKDDSACDDFNTSSKILPPLRSKADSKALKNALKNGKISFLSSLHSPKSISLKDLSFDEAAFGIHSVCEFISLCYTFLIKNNNFSWEELCKITSLNPALLLGLNSGKIEVGKVANLVLFDENKKLTLNSSSLYAKDKIFGEVRAHFINGKKVF
ncbi:MULTISPECIES: metal-dependent hydrolase [unclassified Campylobacter]|uniref:metal-dependent hydrolase n=1 Tax=unclassified Campylobacter TaxID=2593542 RepID=UPI001237DBA5|nr:MULTISPECIES: metal-dependent hydrolase [unclassified Campylobacter]KAA6228412.1 metal-dependent hydrolase [Campylobacter sp. LR185c]KAA6228898.1 metal-dependent hydrolase [Campylobacter sp. LR196d]KAA6229385.1 metal-dependent hydrolase [Campylobacter sp. LR286c]KAA6229852.1 metal-dependent hydrolase [Campylobacter sp. LR264d]KAA6234063.1 metal-dependent hydrolase [Campylobacter sp. LR291e]